MKGRLSIGILVTAVMLGLTGCWTGCGERRLPDPPPKTAPSQEDLIAFHKERARQLDSLMTATTAEWAGLEVSTTGTGLRVARIDSMPGRMEVAGLPDGTLLELHHRFALLDGQVITHWRTDGPIAFEPGATDLPAGFHELIGSAALGDSLRALIPPSRAWGMSGLPPDIPQEAIIDVTLRVDLYRRPA